MSKELAGRTTLEIKNIGRSTNQMYMGRMLCTPALKPFHPACQCNALKVNIVACADIAKHNHPQAYAAIVIECNINVSVITSKLVVNESMLN